ncbi:PilN domain-containing protein [Winslowiella toletana]|uniref:PilN domain-containing protein n=1 Tax=Winslowiella toletana TaxID=92490 RepID=UPI0028BF310F|nr:PilN domain-containing protein [Winslowiella toletana]WNN44646.1 PilN domain-containing protein [Winslowiella toletana]
MVWVNLLHWREQQRAQRQRQWLWALTGITVPGLMAIAWLHNDLATSNQFWQQRLSQRQAAIALADALAYKLAQAQQEHQRLLAVQSQQQQRRQHNQQWYQFALALPQLMPEGVWLTGINKAISGFSVSGSGQQMADISDFRQQLEQQALFQQVKHGPVQRQAGGEMHFSLLASMQEESAHE